MDSLPDGEPNNCNVYVEREDLVYIFDNTNVETVKKMSVYKSSGIGDLGSRLLKNIFFVYSGNFGKYF